MIQKSAVIKVLLAVFLMTVLSFLGYSLLRGYHSDENGLVRDFRQHLIDQDFKSMYRGSSDFMKHNVTEEEFEQRMQVVTDILREYDSDLNFQRDTQKENSIKRIRKDSDPPNSDESSNHSFAILEIGTEPKKGRIVVSWVPQGIGSRLSDLSVGDDRVSVANRVNTLAGEPFISVR